MTDIETVSQDELADLLGVSTNTLRAILKKHPDFPVVSHGKNGVAYGFDPAACAQWWRDHQAAVDEAKSQRRRWLDERQAELFPDRKDDVVDPRLSLEDRRKALEATALELRLRREAGELVDRDDMRRELVAVFLSLRANLLGMPSRLARQLGLDRAVRLKWEEALEAELRQVAQRLEVEAADEADRAAA